MTVNLTVTIQCGDKKDLCYPCAHIGFDPDNVAWPGGYYSHCCLFGTHLEGRSYKSFKRCKKCKEAEYRQVEQ